MLIRIAALHFKLYKIVPYGILYLLKWLYLNTMYANHMFI